MYIEAFEFPSDTLTCLDVERPDLSIVVPCYNESAVILLLRNKLVAVLEDLGVDWEIICVDDGSNDNTLAQLSEMHATDSRLKVVSLSRNFGHQAAISAGLERATGERVAVMDADLQDPPELLGSCLRLMETGYDVVYAVRKSRKESWIKRVCYWLFYLVLHRVSKEHIPIDAGDFCVMNRRVVEALKRMPEQDPFWRGLRAWAGFRQIGLEYERPARAAGDTKYSFSKLLRLALDGLFSFSVLPLRLATLAGLGAVVMSASWAVLHIVWRIGGFELMGHRAAELPGWTTLMCGMFLLGGLQLVMLGCAGEYIGRIFKEVKGRPRWIVQGTMGFECRKNSNTSKLPDREAENSMDARSPDSVHTPALGSPQLNGLRKPGTFDNSRQQHYEATR